MKIAIIGLGHIGGSFSLGIKSIDDSHQFVGFDINEDHCNKALELGLVDEVTDFETAVKSDLVVLAMPVNVIEKQIVYTLDLLPENSILIDLGSTKELFCKLASGHSKRARYVACHPIAGTENSGPEAAFSGLFKHKTVIICNRQESDTDALEIVEILFKQLDMRISYMDASEHDRHIAYVSHLSHISSFALGLTVLKKEKDEKSIFTMAGSGFSSTVRLAKSSPAMWAPIFQQNHTNIIAALDAYIQQLVEFKNVIQKNEAGESFELMEKANEIRRVLLGIENK